jgi:Putative polyhydroxyalkanoic acid system protein (PHA_gran_rgn)
MTRPITVTIPHTLGKDEAKRRIAQGFGQFQEQLIAGLSGRDTGGRGGGLLASALRSTMSFQQNWAGDRLEFAGGGLGQKITGRIDVGDNAVVMQLDLPEMLAALAERFTGQLQHEGRKLLEKKPE